MPRALLFLYAESPVHAGGDASLGAVDLPIQREAGTDLPVIWGQSLKGALRSHARAAWSTGVEDVFGAPPPGSEDDPSEAANQTQGSVDQPSAAGGRGAELRPGSLSVGDAQLVAFPAPTAREIFAWVTSPLTLSRLGRKAGLATVAGTPTTYVSGSTGAVLAAADVWRIKTLLGPYVVKPQFDQVAQEWAGWLGQVALPGAAIPVFFAEKLSRDLLVVPDNVLARITVECAELSPRIQLRATEKTVKHGPFYSEYLPTETILSALLDCRDASHLSRLRDLLDGKVLRLGGNETIGKGLLWCRFAPVEDRALDATQDARAGESEGSRA